MGMLIRSLALTVGIAVVKGVAEYLLDRRAEARAAERRDAEAATGKRGKRSGRRG